MPSQYNVSRQNIVVWVANSRSEDGVYPVLRTRDIVASKMTVIDIGIQPTQKLRAIRIGWKFVAPKRRLRALCVISAFNIVNQSGCGGLTNKSVCRLVEEDRTYDTGVRTRKYWRVDIEHGVADSRAVATACLEFYRLTKSVSKDIRDILEDEDNKLCGVDGLKNRLGVTGDPMLVFQFVFRPGLLPESQASNAVGESRTMSVEEESNNVSLKRGREESPIEIEDTPPPEDKRDIEHQLRPRPNKRVKAIALKNVQSEFKRVDTGEKASGPRAPKGTPSLKPPANDDTVEALRRLEQLNGEKERLQAELNNLLEIKQAQVESLKNALAKHKKL